MIFRRNRTPGTDRQRSDVPRIEYVPMNLAELEAFERVLLHADACLRRSRPDLGANGRNTKLLGRLYRSAGAASVTQPDPARVRIPLQKGDFMWLEFAVRDIEFYRGSADTAREGRHLLNRFNALLGQQRAVIHMGGTPVFDPDAPAPVVVDAPELHAP
ncbi:hypothetical protein [Streptomyces sp. RLB3-6]|uniref:hypothetical protein n=1 Tax=Streptomyces sp. RLB3-6 TaxID=2594457 RepID=UPI0011647ACE|nr:hypothetical protein [Streptomyces sp. RLB3-6]QDN84427.1 hypothetical protein FNV61_00460 [Streptomyces sp. RLB3-6]